MQNIAITIPARLNSTRIKEKMLIEFEGKPLVRNVFDSVKTFGLDTFVLTDSKKIAATIPSENVIMTGEAENGTARIASIINQLNYDTFINIQGDMLGITNETINPIINHYSSPSAEFCATAYKKGYSKDGVKIIHSNGLASWFTRSDIGYGDHHLGIYIYKKIILQQYHLLKGADDKKENLEQLRILRYFPMRAIEVKYEGKEINELKDLTNG